MRWINTDDLITVGFSSKVANYIFKYPWRFMFISFAILEVLLFVVDRDVEKLQNSILSLFGIYFVVIAAGYFLLRSRCYKVEIDKKNNLVNFYCCYSRTVNSYTANNIIVTIGAYITIYINNSKYEIDAAFIHDLVSYLPKDTIIEFKGRYGKYIEREWNKNDRPLLPGSRL